MRKWIPWNSLPCRRVQQRPARLLDPAGHGLGDHVQQPRQAQFDADILLLHIDPPGDGLEHHRGTKVEFVPVPFVVERLYVLRDLGPDRGESAVDATLGFLAPETVRNRDGDRFGAGHHSRLTPRLRQTLRKGLMQGSFVEVVLRMAEVRVRSEIAGSVWKLEVAVGDSVAEDDPLVILESMKMEIPVLAPAAGIVQEILVAEGEAVAEGEIVVVLG